MDKITCPFCGEFNLAKSPKYRRAYHPLFHIIPVALECIHCGFRTPYRDNLDLAARDVDRVASAGSSSPQDAEERYAVGVLKSQIIDIDASAFEDVDPLKVEEHLTVTGWKRRDALDYDVMWSRPKYSDGRKWYDFVWVPHGNQDRFTMQQAIVIIASVEGLSVVKALEDINRIEL